MWRDTQTKWRQTTITMTVNDTHHTSALCLDLRMACRKSPPRPHTIQEIIEIGIVEMDLRALTITRESAYFVCPRRWDAKITIGISIGTLGPLPHFEKCSLPSRTSFNHQARFVVAGERTHS